MASLLNEYQEWHTPVVGAYLLWRFTSEYMKHRSDGVAPSFLLHCVASAILSNPTYADNIVHARTLHSYGHYFIQEGLADKLEKLHYRVAKLLPYTKRAVDIAVDRHLLVWDTNNGGLLPVAINTQARGTRSLSPSVMELGKRAATLGKWFAQSTLNEITTDLGVRF